MDKISIAKVLKPQGLKGEMKCSALTENVEIFKTLKSVICNNKEYKIISSCYRLGFVYIKLENINSIEKAESFRNQVFYISKENYGTLEENSYFIDDLIGLKIFDENNEYVGDVLDVENYGATDILIVREKVASFGVPFLNKVFPVVDIENQKIIASRNDYEFHKVAP